MKVLYSPKHFIISAMAASASLLSVDALASGYAIRETSTSLLGNAYAGSSTSNEDISSMHYNPATLSMIKDNAIYLSGAGIFPGVNAHHISGETIEGSIPGSTSASNVVKDAFVPAGYFAWNINNAWNLGLAVTSPWGLSTAYDNSWIGRYHGVDTKLESVNINPIASYRINKHLSVAAGFQAQYVNAQLKQYGYSAVEPTINAMYIDAPTKVKGQDWGYGYNLGVLYEFTQHTRLGASYQSKIDHTIEGDASQSYVAYGLPPEIPLPAAFNADASAPLTTPEQVNLGLSHDINQQWTVMGDIQWTRWDRFQSLNVTIDSPYGEQNVETLEEWKNTFFYALGVDYKPSTKWILRAGAAYDQSPVDNKYRNPTIPDSDRVLLSAGVGYNFTKCVRLDAGYMYAFFRDTDVDLALEEGSATSTSLDADYTGNANIVSLGLNWLF